MSEPILQVDGLKVHFPVRKGVFKKVVGHVRAVDGISFSVNPGETYGLVGESGCGKTTVGKAVVRLHPAREGRILYRGQDLLTMNRQELGAVRSRIQMIFQDPFSSLNPRMTVGNIIGEPIRLYEPGADIESRVLEYMEMCGLRPECLRRYPHQFSGGQRQRIGIARALASKPEIIVADEPVSALDVSIQAQVVNLMRSLQRELGLTYVFIAHDLAVVRHISHRIGVMYLGRLVEEGTSKEVCTDPVHPYTRGLIASVPIPDPGVRQDLLPLTGEIPSPLNAPSGCTFRTRCAYATDICRSDPPAMEQVGRTHRVACHHWRTIREK